MVSSREAETTAVVEGLLVLRAENDIGEQRKLFAESDASRRKIKKEKENLP